ncbi:TPA: hypothetical protein ACK21Z_003190 [Vibrio harveyi]|uniref:hypothetical protein n=1 Tax=Vibrio harveyi TaxID=669 RepID=UPI00390750B6
MRGMDIEYQGCKGLREISEKFGIPDSTLRYRLYANGNDIEKAVNRVKGARGPKEPHEYKGVVGLKDISSAFGINYNTLRQRLNAGMSIQEAVEKKVEKRTSKVPEKKEKKKVELVGIKNPDLLDSSWKLALGMGASL